ncbi:hypothetical protein M8J77_003355 [Diaphorina citri]|nr:hypothetical protein M8J77_003355 [Diaphorina citri]
MPKTLSKNTGEDWRRTRERGRKEKKGVEDVEEEEAKKKVDEEKGNETDEGKGELEKETKRGRGSRS